MVSKFLPYDICITDSIQFNFFAESVCVYKSQIVKISINRFMFYDFSVVTFFEDNISLTCITNTQQ